MRKINIYILDKFWFVKHQQTLIFLLNKPFIGKIFRWYLSIKSRKPVLKILPECIHFLSEQNTAGEYNVKAEIFTTPVISALFIRKFYLVFFIMHLLDFALDFVLPRYSFGFSTLTKYPAYTIGNSVDAYFEKTSDTDRTFSWLRTDENVGDSGVNYQGVHNQALSLFISSSLTTDRYRYLSRIFTSFDLSSIHPDSVCNDADVSLFSIDKTNELGDCSVYMTHWFSEYLGIVDGDDYLLNWQNLSIMDQITYSNMVTSAYNTFSASNSLVQNAFGKAFGVAFLLEDDYANSESTITWASRTGTGFQFARSDVGYTNAPKLVVNYTISDLKMVICGH